MRYQPEHKAKVHRKIVKDASRRVRGEGLTGAAVAAVMRDMGLTHGGFYKHFESKEELLVESLREAFRDISDKLVSAAQQTDSEPAWKAIVRSYLSLEYCDRVERGCPLAALAPEIARSNRKMKGQIFAELVKYKDQMVRFMPGGIADREAAFFSIFSTMIGATEIARMLPEKAMREKVLMNAREFLLRSF